MMRNPFLDFRHCCELRISRCLLNKKRKVNHKKWESNTLVVWSIPASYRFLFSPNNAASILGGRKTGGWTTETSFFPTVEHTGEVSSYGDFNENGSSGANTNFPQRQAYRYQTIVEYGELELERAGLAKLNWTSEQNGAAALSMNKYQNLTYFFGVRGMQNYGLLNDPNLTAALIPAPKGYGGNAWIVNNLIAATYECGCGEVRPSGITLDLSGGAPCRYG
jgi:hypothetical protein